MPRFEQPFPTTIHNPRGFILQRCIERVELKGLKVDILAYFLHLGFEGCGKFILRDFGRRDPRKDQRSLHAAGVKLSGWFIEIASIRLMVEQSRRPCVWDLDSEDEAADWYRRTPDGGASNLDSRMRDALVGFKAWRLGSGSCPLGVIFDVLSTRRSLPQVLPKPTFACTATSDAVGRERKSVELFDNFLRAKTLISTALFDI